LRQGLRYLPRSQDCLFHPETVHLPAGTLTAADLGERLRSGSPSLRLAALWEIRQRALTDPTLVDPLADCLWEIDHAIPGEAALTLAGFGAAAEPALPVLLKALWADHRPTRAGAAVAVGEIRRQAGTVVPELSAQLSERNEHVVSAAAAALALFGTEAEPASGHLLEALGVALVDCKHALVQVLASALLAVSPDARARVRDHFGGRDPELRSRALAALREVLAQECPPDDEAGPSTGIRRTR
jgi:hypothetical protein